MMKFKRHAIALATSAVVGVAAMPAYATITGVPGEALLVPLAFNDDNANRHETYVQIIIPETLGRDLVINTYTGTHVTPLDGALTYQADTVANAGGEFKIHWVYFDENSETVESGDCYGSPGDSVIWSSNGVFNSEQAAIDADLPAAYSDAPTSVCGTRIPSPEGDIGYVVFQTDEGSKGYDADFMMVGTAWIVDDYVEEIPGPDEQLLAVPVIPLVDGEDKPGTNEQPSLRINEVITHLAGQLGGVKNPARLAPLVGGVRMNNGDGIVEEVVLTAGIQGNWNSNEQGYSLHAFWLDREAANRKARAFIWDEHEQKCNDSFDIPDEVNVYVFNMNVLLAQPAGWNKVDNGFRQNKRVTNLVKALKVNGYNDDPYCATPGWDYTVQGYAQYFILEQDDVHERLTSAGVFFEAQEDNNRFSDRDAWTTAMMGALGTQ